MKGTVNQIPLAETPESPTATMDGLRLNEQVRVPNRSRTSYDATRTRFNNSSNKVFQFTKIDRDYFTIKRIR